MGKRNEKRPPSKRRICWYSSSTTTVSRGPMLATCVVKMFGRSWSRSAARRPVLRAWS
jgi:hypothetical protein